MSSVLCLIENSKSGLPPKDVERFFFVLKGVVNLNDAYGAYHRLEVDSYDYLPPNSPHSFSSDGAATLVVFERRHDHLEHHKPQQIIDSTDKQPVLETPGEVFQLKKLLPTTLAYDFNIHVPCSSWGLNLDGTICTSVVWCSG